MKRRILPLSKIFFCIGFHLSTSFLNSACQRTKSQPHFDEIILSSPHPNETQARVVKRENSKWFLKDPTEGVEGTSTELAIQEFPKNEKSRRILVAVIDSGVDIDHPIFSSKIWHDTQGLSGWNFLGNPDGRNLLDSNTELARMYGKLSELEASEALKIKRDFEAAVLKEKTLVQNPLIPEELRVREWDEFIHINFNPNFDPSAIIGDHPEQLDEQEYGNNNILGGDGFHGTHVAGIIAQQADAVEILPLRVVPRGGDERDKDVGNAILYAVNRGARILNLSFGKLYSLNAKWVQKAVKYAEDHDVLIIHSAGNDAINTDYVQYYPHPLSPSASDSWIEVGASGPKKGDYLIAQFSNYGESSIDLFAPGIDIDSAVPLRGMASLDGTSMAAPQVSGVAALILSRFPQLHANEVKNILMTSARRYPNLTVKVPQLIAESKGTPSEQKTSFEHLSISGGILDARAALRLAQARALFH